MEGRTQIKESQMKPTFELKWGVSKSLPPALQVGFRVQENKGRM